MLLFFDIIDTVQVISDFHLSAFAGLDFPAYIESYQSAMQFRTEIMEIVNIVFVSRNRLAAKISRTFQYFIKILQILSLQYFCPSVSIGQQVLVADSAEAYPDSLTLLG